MYNTQLKPQILPAQTGINITNFFREIHLNLLAYLKVAMTFFVFMTLVIIVLIIGSIFYRLLTMHFFSANEIKKQLNKFGTSKELEKIL